MNGSARIRHYVTTCKRDHTYTIINGNFMSWLPQTMLQQGEKRKSLLCLYPLDSKNKKQPLGVYIGTLKYAVSASSVHFLAYVRHTHRLGQQLYPSK